MRFIAFVGLILTLALSTACVAGSGGKTPTQGKPDNPAQMDTDEAP